MKSVTQQLKDIYRASDCKDVSDCEIGMVMVKNITIYNKLEKWTSAMQIRYYQLGRKKLKLLKK